MANRIKKQVNTKNSFQENTCLIMGVFVFAVLCIFPLVFTHFYFNILETKYQFYCGCVIAAILAMTGYGLASGQIETYIKNNNIKEVMKKLGITDWAIIGFWLCNVISWILCDWRWEAFWGTSGRFNGVFLITLYLVIYFLITRFFGFKRWYLDAMLAVGICVSLFGITDYFQMDILNFKERMVEDQKAIYTSTLGNINTYTVYVGIMASVSLILFATEDKLKRSLWYFGNFVISGFALIMGTSDNAYLSLAALFGFAPLYLFKTFKGLKRYLISVATFITIIQCIDWINALFGNVVLGIDSAFSLISEFSGLPVIMIASWLFAGIVLYLANNKKVTFEQEINLGKWLCRLWCIVIIGVVVAVAYVLFDANIAGNADKYKALSSYLVFNDEWGTRRGFIWIRAFDVFFNKFTLLQKLFGYGPDTFGLVITYFFGSEKIGDTRILYDSAHNEYIHYLITVGIAGLFTYIMFLGSGIVRLVKKMKNKPEVAAVMFAVLAYAVQAVVNINIPIATPIVLTLLMMGLSKCSDSPV